MGCCSSESRSSRVGSDAEAKPAAGRGIPPMPPPPSPPPPSPPPPPPPRPPAAAAAAPRPSAPAPSSSVESEAARGDGRPTALDPLATAPPSALADDARGQQVPLPAAAPGVPGPRPRPEASAVVVARRRGQVARGVPGDGPQARPRGPRGPWRSAEGRSRRPRTGPCRRRRPTRRRRRGRRRAGSRLPPPSPSSTSPAVTSQNAIPPS